VALERIQASLDGADAFRVAVAFVLAFVDVVAATTAAAVARLADFVASA
jgi:hypothetical protein